MPRSTGVFVSTLPGLCVAVAGLGVAWLIHLGLPGLPVLTACLLIGLVLGQLPWWPSWRGVLGPGIAQASRRLLRIGIVLLGLQLSIGQLLSLGWRTLLLIVGLVVVGFAATYGIARALRIRTAESMLLAAGYSICGVSAIGATAAVTKAAPADQSRPTALVTLFGSLAILVLPLLAVPLGLDAEDFGTWVGASVHDVGQVVATAQTAGAAALAVAVTVKLVRVLMLAPMTAGIGLVQRLRNAPVGEKRPPIVPLFVAGFVVAVALRSLIDLPAPLLDVASWLQSALLGTALVGIGSSIRLVELVRSGARPIAAGLLSWVVMAGLGLVVVVLGPAA